MKFKLRLDRLAPGDIILAGYNDRRSRQIQQATGSKYSHAMLMWYGSILHAADLVITENPSRLLFDADEAVCVLRLKDMPGNDLRIKHLIEYARQFVGMLYDTDALKALVRGVQPVYNDNRQMCSKFVAQCYEYVCYDLVEDYETCSPQDLYDSPMLDRIEDVLVESDDWDVKYAQSYDVTKLQSKAIYTFITELYKVHPEADIMSLPQLEEYIERHPDESDSILQLLQTTDYFTLWSKEMEYCPYLYDKQQFYDFWRDNHVKIAIGVIECSKRIVVEQQANIDYYREQIKKTGDLKYYREMIELRENIVAAAQKRIDVAEQILADNQIVKIKLDLGS